MTCKIQGMVSGGCWSMLYNLSTEIGTVFEDNFHLDNFLWKIRVFMHLSHCARKWKKNGLLFSFSFTFLICLCVCLFISLCVCLFEDFFLRKISFLQKIKLNMNFLFYSILKLFAHLHKTSPRQHAREAIVKSLHNSISGIHIICSVLRETHDVEINFAHLQGAYNLFIHSINTVKTIFDKLPCAKL